MFPLKDSHPTEKTPLINYLIIITNIVVFVMMLASPNVEAFIYHYGFIPSQFSFFNPVSYLPIFTGLFLHGGFFHILSNMWFLRIFGDNIEDRLGHLPYLGFYLLAGVVATFTQYFFAPHSMVPMIGASGAISGVAGAYFVLYRDSRVKTLLALFIIWTIVELPASVVLGYWFITQLFAGVGSLATVDPNQGGIAFFAHIGGFIFGYLVAKKAGAGGGT